MLPAAGKKKSWPGISKVRRLFIPVPYQLQPTGEWALLLPGLHTRVVGEQVRQPKGLRAGKLTPLLLIPFLLQSEKKALYLSGLKSRSSPTDSMSVSWPHPLAAGCIG